MISLTEFIRKRWLAILVVIAIATVIHFVIMPWAYAGVSCR